MAVAEVRVDLAKLKAIINEETGEIKAEKLVAPRAEVGNLIVTEEGARIVRRTVEVEDPNRGLILTAEDGSKWMLVVDSQGSLSTIKVT